jgi:polyisoprenoid-binding protein YceI
MAKTQTLTAAETPAAAATYTIDPVHSEVLFSVRHLLSRVTGRFGQFSGTVTFDPANLSASAVAFRIETASIDTNVADRDTHLRSADFFDVERHPGITFESRRVTGASPDQFVVSGPLTIHGVERTIDLPVRYLGSVRDPWGVEKAAFEAAITLDRKDFGLTWNAPLETGGLLVGDEVRVTLEIQAARA